MRVEIRNHVMANIAKEKRFHFAIEIVKLCGDLEAQYKIYPLTNQLMRSGTAIGALIRESEFAESTKDFIHKLQIALKEANETLYWLELLHKTHYLPREQFECLYATCNELVKILIKSIKTLKTKQIATKP